METVITIGNVVNLTLVGASSGVKILCNSPQSGLTVEQFRYLTIENLTFSECIYMLNTSKPTSSAIFLGNGSEVSLNRIALFKNTSVPEFKGLLVKNVTGSFSIRNSTFYTPNTFSVTNLYPPINKSSHFEFTGNEVVFGLFVGLYTPNVQVVIADSSFKLGDVSIPKSNNVTSLQVDFVVTTNNSIKISNSKFAGEILLPLCDLTNCADRIYDCSSNFTELSGVTGNSITTGIAKNCTVLIKDSKFTSFIVTNVNVANDGNITSTPKQAQFYNVTLTNGKSDSIAMTIFNSSVLFANCTVEENIGSAIYARNSLLTFQDVNLFRHNIGLVGGVIRLSSSYMHLLPHTTLHFEDNRADYVGGAIYIESEKEAMCFYNTSQNDTVKMVFINNTAGYGGSSLYGDGFDQCTSYNEVINLYNTEEDPSAVAGEPHDVCFCEYDKFQPDCSHRNFTIRAFPGKTSPFVLLLSARLTLPKRMSLGLLPEPFVLM